jgi:hypothetical protein
MFRLALSIGLTMLIAASFPLAAQKVTIEREGEAFKAASAQQLATAAVEDAVGKAPAGRAQVVFFRSSTSPGNAVAVRESAGGEPLIELDAGMYYVAVLQPGAHAYATSDVGPLPMDLEPGRTYYVQAIRNRKGQAQLLRSNADKFARAANR